MFLLPRGTIDEVHWRGQIHHMVVAIHRRLLTEALDETANEADIEVAEHGIWATGTLRHSCERWPLI
jgi:hypothetical protein